jgi:hypothetical protein
MNGREALDVQRNLNYRDSLHPTGGSCEGNRRALPHETFGYHAA